MFTVMTAAAMAAGSDPRVIRVLEGSEFVRRGIVADLVERPAGIADEQFARRLIDAEGLHPWNGKPLNSAPVQSGMGTMAVFSADGREIIVKYVSGDAQRTGSVCRVRLTRGGMSIARWHAYRWCASAFGLSFPEAPPPFVTTARPQR